VGFFSAKQSQLQSSFLLVSSKSRNDYIFGKVTDPAVAKEYGIKDEGVIAFKSFDDGQTVYSGAPKTSDLQKWVELHSLPLIGEFSTETADQYHKRGLPIAKLYIPHDLKSMGQQVKYYLNRLKKAAEEFKGKILVTVAKKSNFDSEVNDFGFKDQEAGLLIDDLPNQRKYRSEEKFSAESTAKFFKDYFDKVLRPYVKVKKFQKRMMAQ